MQKVTFETFLCGVPARDYVYQKTEYPDEESYWGYWSKQAMVGGIRLNLDQAVVPESLGRRAVGINADMAQSIRNIVGNEKRI